MRPRREAAAVLVAVAALGGGLIVGLGSGMTPASGSPTPAQPSATRASASGTTAPPRPALATTPPASPSAAPASAPASRGPGLVAARIQIPRLDIDLPIVEGDGITAPMGVAAHFPGTAWPDAGSNTYLYGHAQEGMFLRLWDARLGDEILLTLVDGSTRCFRVDEIRPETPWNDISVLLPTPDERLTLQTSTSFTPTAPRFVVVALPCT